MRNYINIVTSFLYFSLMKIASGKLFRRSNLNANAFAKSYLNEFDEDAYLDANLDVKESGLRAKYHFVKYGFLERRPLTNEDSFADWVLCNLEERNDFSRNFPWLELCDRYSTSQEKLLAETLVDFIDIKSLTKEFPGLEDCQVNLFEALSAKQYRFIRGS